MFQKIPVRKLKSVLPCRGEERNAVEKTKNSLTKGEDGFWERNTEAATAASSIFETEEEFQDAANRYFAECDTAGVLYSEAGLCLALGKYNAKKRPVCLGTLRKWHDGETCSYLRDVVRQAYLRIMEQIQTDPRYQEKGGMSTKAIFLMKQARLGGYQDKQEQKTETTVTILHGSSMDESDFA